MSGKEEEAAEGLAGLGDVSDEVAEKSRGGRLGPPMKSEGSTERSGESARESHAHFSMGIEVTVTWPMSAAGVSRRRLSPIQGCRECDEGFLHGRQTICSANT